MTRCRFSLAGMGIAAVLLFSAGAADAQQSASSAGSRAGDRVAYVDVGKALNEVEEGKAAISRLKQEMDRKQEQALKQREQFKDKMEKFQKQKAMMKPEARDDRERDLQREMDELQKTFMQMQQDLMESQNQVTEEIGKKLREVVKKIGDRENYNQIFSTEGLLYFKRHLDITAEVVQAYNRQYGSKP